MMNNFFFACDQHVFFSFFDIQFFVKIAVFIPYFQPNKCGSVSFLLVFSYFFPCCILA